MFEPTVRDGALRVRAPGARWLKTGTEGGFVTADAAYNLTVPEGFDRTDLDAYVEERRRRADFDPPGPTLLTGVEQSNARGARMDDVVAYATVGLTNPVALPVPPGDGGSASADGTTGTPRGGKADPDGRPIGTVNLVVGTTRALDDGPLAGLLSVAVEAKAATLLAETGFPGTTSDAAVAGTALDGEPAAFAGSGTPVGRRGTSLRSRGRPRVARRPVSRRLRPRIRGRGRPRRAYGSRRRGLQSVGRRRRDGRSLTARTGRPATRRRGSTRRAAVRSRSVRRVATRSSRRRPRS